MSACDPNPCVNNASCMNGINNYMRLCMNGYSVTNCQINNDDCQPNPCLNGGICFDGISNYMCMCPS